MDDWLEYFRRINNGQTMSERILVAISGGVDSAVAAARLQEAGAEVETAYMRTWQSEDGLGHCPWREDLESARSVALHLGLPFRIVNMIENYRRFVVEDLIEGYCSGRTPNPDMLCNRFIKFGALVDYARQEGFDGLATGHYCRIEGRRPPDSPKAMDDRSQKSGGGVDRSNGPRLLEGHDETKDQSYFLAMVDGRNLNRLHFPLGTITKKEVRRLARQLALPNAERKDSQDICFLGGRISIQQFLDRSIPKNPGSIVDRSGKILGRHGGLHHYTIGQRHGIGVPSNRDFEKYVVVEKDLIHNRLVVAFESDPENGLWSTTARVRGLNFIGEEERGRCRLLLRVRYRDRPTPGEVDFRNDGTAIVKFDEPQRAIARGQVLAIYRGPELLGGGIFY